MSKVVIAGVERLTRTRRAGWSRRTRDAARVDGTVAVRTPNRRAKAFPARIPPLIFSDIRSPRITRQWQNQHARVEIDEAFDPMQGFSD